MRKNIPSDILRVAESYDPRKLTIGAIGSHSALEIFDGAKDEDFRTLAVCQKGRERPYMAFKRIVDELILLDNFSDIIREEVQAKLRRKNVIFIPHRSFTTYVPYDSIENEFRVPIFGNRMLLRSEERDAPRNQYYLLKKAGIKFPKIFAGPKDIDRPVIIKIHESKRKTERAFFTASSYDEYQKKVERRIKQGIVSPSGLKKQVIEELVIGTHFNFNYFYSPIDDNLEFLGIDRRLQTNLYDFVNLPARQQLEIDLELQNIEIGHTPATIRESMLEKVFDVGERFVKAVKKEYPPSPMGPFALQGAVNVDLEIVIFDVSPRVPGSPLLSTTSPYSKYYFGEVVGVGRRIAMEIKKGVEQDRLTELVT